MNTQRVLLLALLPLFAVAACDGDGSDDDAMETDTGPGNDAGGNSGDEAGDESGNDSGDDPGGDDSAGESSGGNGSGDDSGSNVCDGGWYLGSVPFVGETFIDQCDDNPPSTCLTGTYIVFDDGDCWCLPECSQAGLSEGEACTTDGSVTCTYIENDEGGSNGVFCVPPQWQLCG